MTFSSVGNVGGTVTANATLTISKKSVTITGVTAAGKTYDGTTTASLSGGAVSGAVSPDVVSVVAGSGTFASRNVGGQAVTATGYSISGTNVSNYTLSAQPTVANASITARALAVTAPTIASKVYNGLTTAGAVTVGTLSGFVSGETVTATATAAAYSSANVGSYAGVVITYTLVNGSGLAANYSLATGTATGNITARPLTVTAIAQSKTHGQTVTFGSGSTAFTSSGLQNSETIGTVTLAVSGSGGAAAATVAGSPYTITPSAATGGTFTAGNYSISYATGQLTVNKASTATAVSSSANPSPTGSSVTLTATLTAVAPGSGIPTGTVLVKTNGAAFGSPTLDGSAVATTNTASLVHGTNTVTVEYAGDGNFFGSTNSLSPALIVNLVPVANSYTILRRGGTGTTKVLISTLQTNATDGDGDALVLTSVSATSAGGATVTNVGAYVFYTPSTSINTNDTFTYSIQDGFGGAATGTVNVNINPANQARDLNVSTTTNGFQGSFFGILNSPYTVQYTDILPASWQTLTNVTTSSSGLGTFTDPGPVVTNRFYRIVYP